MIKGTEYIPTNGEHATVVEFEYKDATICLQRHHRDGRAYWWFAELTNPTCSTKDYKNPLDAIIEAKNKVDEAKS